MHQRDREDATAGEDVGSRRRRRHMTQRHVYGSYLHKNVFASRIQEEKFRLILLMSENKDFRTF